MKQKIKSLMTARSAGKKQEAQADCSRTYTLYDTASKCPLWAYVDAVCNDNLNSLVIEGEAPVEALENARTSLIVELSEISGNSQAMSVNNALKTMYRYRVHIQGLYVCMHLAAIGNYDEPVNYLSSTGIRVNSPQNDAEKDKLIRRIQSAIKEKSIHLNKEVKRYQDLTRNENDSRVTAQHYNEQLVYLSTHFKFDINMDISLAKYGAYLKTFNNSIKKQ